MLLMLLTCNLVINLETLHCTMWSCLLSFPLFMYYSIPYRTQAVHQPVSWPSGWTVARAEGQTGSNLCSSGSCIREFNLTADTVKTWPHFRKMIKAFVENLVSEKLLYLQVIIKNLGLEINVWFEVMVIFCQQHLEFLCLLCSLEGWRLHELHWCGVERSECPEAVWSSDTALYTPLKKTLPDAPTTLQDSGRKCQASQKEEWERWWRLS